MVTLFSQQPSVEGAKLFRSLLAGGAMIAATIGGASTASADPANLTCSDVGGVFVAHGTDGRGDCEPADSRPKCHVPPAEQDPNYLANLVMSPPFSGGSLQYPYMVPMMINGATNKDCWKLPPS
jgi:hypothetical protein